MDESMVRRSKRGRTQLPNDFAALDKAAKLTAVTSIFEEKQRLAKIPPIPPKPFRFIDLPTELRAHILSFLVVSDGPQILSNIVAPLITRVSKAVRADAFPVFFGENTWFIRIFCNLDALHNNPTLPFIPKPPEQLKRQARTAGVVQLRKPTRDWIESLGDDTACFHNVDFEIAATRLNSVKNPGRYPVDTTPYLCQIKLRMRQGPHPISAEILEAPPHPLRPNTQPWLGQVIDGFNAKVQKIGQRDDFRGLILQDLKDMALTFRCPVPARDG